MAKIQEKMEKQIDGAGLVAKAALRIIGGMVLDFVISPKAGGEEEGESPFGEWAPEEEEVNNEWVLGDFNIGFDLVFQASATFRKELRNTPF